MVKWTLLSKNSTMANFRVQERNLFNTSVLIPNKTVASTQDIVH